MNEPTLPDRLAYAESESDAPSDGRSDGRSGATARPGTEVVSASDLSQYYSGASIDRGRDKFVLELLRELSGVLQEAVGVKEAEGFVSLVGGRIGVRMNEDYRRVSGCDRLDRRQVAAALIDLKRRIDGGFTVERIDDDRITLVNTACPFGDFVRDRESLCMMTSNVFGRLAADNLGYARVELAATIAKGDDCCRVEIHLGDGEAGREYFG